MIFAMYLSTEKFIVFFAMQLRISHAVTHALRGQSMVRGFGSFDHGCCVPARESSILSRNSSRKPPACIPLGSAGDARLQGCSVLREDGVSCGIARRAAKRDDLNNKVNSSPV